MTWNVFRDVNFGNCKVDSIATFVLKYLPKDSILVKVALLISSFFKILMLICSFCGHMITIALASVSWVKILNKRNSTKIWPNKTRWEGLSFHFLVKTFWQWVPFSNQAIFLLFVCLFVYLSIHQLVYLSVRLSVHKSIHHWIRHLESWFVHLLIHPSINQCVHFLIRISLCPLVLMHSSVQLWRIMYTL